MKKIFSVRTLPIEVDFALFLVRIVCGYAFILHGWGKIQHPFGWMGEQSTMPAIFQAAAAVSEFGGGIALVLGFLTRLGAVGIGCTMLVAVYIHCCIKGDPFVSRGGASYELAAVFLCIAILIVIAGPGRFSIDRKAFGITT